METPNKQTPKKVLFGQTNSLSVPSKRTSGSSAIKIPEKQFGSAVKLPESEKIKPDIMTPSKPDYKLTLEDSLEEEHPLYTGKNASFFVSENGAWVRKAKGGTVLLFEIEERQVKKTKRNPESLQGSPLDLKDTDTLNTLDTKEQTSPLKVKIKSLDIQDAEPSEPISDKTSEAKETKSGKSTRDKLQVIYRDNTTLKKIMLNTILLSEKKTFQMPQQNNSIGFCGIIDGKLETIGFLFKETASVHEFMAIVKSYNE